MNFVLYFVFWICLLTLSESNNVYGLKANDWGYKEGDKFKGPSQWKDLPNATCGGQRQSPIDIKLNYTTYWSDLKPINIFQKAFINDKVFLEKHFSSIYLGFNDNWKISFGRNGCLTPVTLHWHWGSINSIGSEHKFNGKQYPIEAHLVNYDCNLYSSYEKASVSASGLHVIGFFYKIGKNNTILDKIIDAMKPVMTRKTFSVFLQEIHPEKLLPEDLVRYYRYEGSLTTPPCTENVIWTVLENTQEISEYQLSIFRNLKFGIPEHGQLVNNFRPIMPQTTPEDYVMRMVFSSFSHSVVVVANFTLAGTLLLIVSIVLNDN